MSPRVQTQLHAARSGVVRVLDELAKHARALRVVAQDLLEAHAEVNPLPKRLGVLLHAAAQAAQTLCSISARALCTHSAEAER